MNLKQALKEVWDLFVNAIEKNVNFGCRFNKLRNLLCWLKGSNNLEDWLCQPKENVTEGKRNIQGICMAFKGLQYYLKYNDEDHRHVFLAIAVLKMAVWGQSVLSVASLLVLFVEKKICLISGTSKEAIEYAIAFYACYFVLKWFIIALAGLILTVFYDSRDWLREIKEWYQSRH